MTTRISISCHDLCDQLGRADQPLIVDVCLKEDFQNAPHVIPTALRHGHDAIEELVPFVPAQGAIVVCQKGLKLSQGAAAILRCSGLKAAYLSGGMVAWAEGDFPAIPAHEHSPNTLGSKSRWLRTQDTAASRISAWATHRFIDPNAQILDIEQDQADAIGEKFAAHPLPDPASLAKSIPALARAIPKAAALVEDLWQGLTEEATYSLVDSVLAAERARS